MWEEGLALMNKVYIAKVEKKNIKEAVSFCLGKIIEETIKVTDSVLIKPNFLDDSPAHTGCTTDLGVIRAIIEILQGKGINNIILAEASFTDTERIFRNLKVYDLEGYGIKVINLEKEEKETVDFPSAYILKKMVLPRLVIDADVIIDIPKIKTHAQTMVTLGLKNLFGFLYTPQRKISHIVDIDKAIVDIYTYLRTSLGKKMISLVDAIYCLEGKLGPNIGNVVNMNLLISGTDLLCVDTACVWIMGSDPRKIRHLLLCEQAGLGNLIKPEVIGESIDSVKREFNMPFDLSVILPQFTKLRNTIFKKQPFVRYQNRCITCGICMEACPENCIRLTPNRLIINYDECIGCLCCAEGCPNKVFEYKIRNIPLFLLIKNVYLFVKWILLFLKPNKE